MNKQLIIKSVIFFTLSFVVILSVMTLILGTIQPKQKTQQKSQNVEARIDSMQIVNSARDSVIQNIKKTNNPTVKTSDPPEEKSDRQLDSLKTLLSKMEKEKERLKEELNVLIEKDKAEKKKISEALTENAKKMAKIYENMDAAEAAGILEALEPELAVTIISSMKKRQAAKVMAAMSPDTAIYLSKKLASLY